jgi:hypothetical protein
MSRYYTQPTEPAEEPGRLELAIREWQRQLVKQRLQLVKQVVEEEEERENQLRLPDGAGRW